MLFGGEAIFGSLNFSGAGRAAGCQADLLLRRARRSASEAQSQTFGPAVFGSLKRNSNAAQAPTVYENGGVYALAMGEIYDHTQEAAALQLDPERSGFLAEGYRSEGAEFLQRLDGTFGAVLWDAHEDEFFLLCDPRADAHLYYRVDANGLVFSSSLGLLVENAAEIDLQAVYEFLRFLYIAPPRTIYRGISRLEPGHYLRIRRGDARTETLGSTRGESHGAVSSGQAGEILEKFDQLFRNAVRKRLGGRRVGVFLSSGVDSATLTAVCQNVNPGAVEAFTVGFDNAALDEAQTAKSLARHIGVPHTELRFEMKDYRRAFDLMSKGFDQPFGDPAGLPLILACEAVHERVDVISGGVGGDDLFSAPVPRHLWFSTTVSARLPRFCRKRVAEALKRLRFEEVARYASLFDFDDVEELFVTWSGWSRRELEELAGKPISLAESGFYRAFRAQQMKGAQALYDALAFFPPDDCRFEAAALVDAPVELPYHDASLNAYVRGLPTRYRFSDGATKILLRQLFSRYFPDRLLADKKHYFNIPLQALLAHSDYELVHEFLGQNAVRRAGLVDVRDVQPWVDRFLAGDEKLRFKVWALVVLHAWALSKN